MTKRVRQKDIREDIAYGIAHDLSAEYGRDDWYEYTRNLKLECIAYSRGTYGANGAEWISRADGELYAVGSRNCALASLF
nr:MAG TPA: hypothetical protein [Caudoviricetes sp.]